MTLRTKLRAFIRKWIKPTAHEAGQVLARAAAERRQRLALTERERIDATHAKLRAEKAAGWPGAAQ